MTNSIDIIANAIRIADGNHTLGACRLAEIVVNTLTDEQIVANAEEALRQEGFGYGLTDAAVRNMALTVLRSVGQA